MTSDPQESQRNQSAAANLEDFVMRLETAVYRGIVAEMEPFGLSHVEFFLLRACLEKKERNAAELAQLLPVDASRISRTVNTLVETGLLRRRRLRSDRRIVMLSLTAEGLDLTTRLHERMQQRYTSLVEGVSDRDLRVLESATARILANHQALAETAQGKG